jgi:two-component system sensor histidine kinase KdpD
MLYALSRDLAVARDLDEVLRAITANVAQTFGREVAILLPADPMGHLTRPENAPEFIDDANEMAVATWAFEHRQVAGRGTDTLPAARARYMPLRTARGVIGVMGVKPTDPNAFMPPEQRRTLEAFASLAALAVERVQLAEAARNAHLLEATEKLQTALLNSISHDLRTPLVSITGALTSLREDGARLDSATQQELIETASQEAARLNRFVGNLLDMTRLEAGAMKIVRQPCDVQDLIGTALAEADGRLQQRTVTIDVPPDLPFVPADCNLMGQVLRNLVDNALKYSPADSEVVIRARRTEGQIRIEVADRGIGIPPQDLEYIFDKFYRVQHPSNVTGTGLGLSICKGIVEAHGGRISAQNRPGGGTVVTVALPSGEPPEPRA